MNKTPIHLLIAICLCACSEASDPQSAPNPIVLSAGVRGEITASRGDGAIEDDSKPLSISLFRADQTYGTAYDEGPKSVQMGAESDADEGRTINTGMFYLSDGTTKSRIAGIYPAVTNDQYDQNTRAVTYSAIDGATDIMASNTVEGSASQPIADRMTFDHLLTRVVVKIKAADANEAATWGPVQSISVVGKKQNIVLTLPAPNDGTGKATIATGGTTDNLPLCAGDGAAITAAMDIPIVDNETEAEAFGHAMFAPVGNGETLSLEVQCEHRSHTLSIALLPFEAGREHIITITFTAVSPKIETVTIMDWIVDMNESYDLSQINVRPSSTTITNWDTTDHEGDLSQTNVRPSSTTITNWDTNVFNTDLNDK